MLGIDFRTSEGDKDGSRAGTSLTQLAGESRRELPHSDATVSPAALWDLQAPRFPINTTQYFPPPCCAVAWCACIVPIHLHPLG